MKIHAKLQVLPETRGGSKPEYAALGLWDTTKGSLGYLWTRGLMLHILTPTLFLWREENRDAHGKGPKYWN